MKEPENLRTDYDKDYDNDSWLGKKEISFSTKLLVAIGGITSFGGLFPMVVDKTAGLFNLTVGKGFFVCFSLGYFVLPLVLFLLWVWITDRVATPDMKDSFRKRWSFKGIAKEFMNFPITYRYQWIVLCHILCVTVYLTITIYFFGKANGITLILPALLLIISPVIALATFVGRDYPWNKKNTKPMLWILLIVILSLVGWHLETSAEKHKPAGSGNYRDLIKVDQISKKLKALEKQISNEVDRFYIKSSVQAVVTIDSLRQLPAKIDSAFFIDPHLRFLGKIMLLDSINADSIISNTKQSYTIDGQKSRKVLFLQPAYHFLLNKDAKLHQKDRIIIRNDTVILQNNKIELPDLMEIISKLINGMIDSNEHRIYPSDLASDHNVTESEREKISALLNHENSKKLNEWVDHFYLPYCQRKAQADIEDIAQQTAWVWQDMQIRGIAISLTTLLLLVLFYIELIDLKSYRIRKLEKDKSNDENESAKGYRAGKIAELNKKADYLLFPLTMTITIVGMLLIPVITQIEYSDISLSRSFWMLNVPSLHLPDAISPVKKDQEKIDVSISTDIDIETEEIQKLINSLDALRKRLDRLDIPISVKVAGSSDSLALRELGYQIKKNQDSIRLHRTKIDSLNQMLEDLKPKKNP